MEFKEGGQAHFDRFQDMNHWTYGKELVEASADLANMADELISSDEEADTAFKKAFHSLDLLERFNPAQIKYMSRVLVGAWEHGLAFNTWLGTIDPKMALTDEEIEANGPKNDGIKLTILQPTEGSSSQTVV